MTTLALSAPLIITIVVQLLKSLLEIRIQPTAQVHDPLIRAITVVLGVGGELGYAATQGSVTLSSMWTPAGQGFVDALVAITVYHVVTADWFATQTAGQPPPVPPVPSTTTPTSATVVIGPVAPATSTEPVVPGS